MSKLETNTIDTVSGTSTLQVGSTNTTTITLGASGDTINIPSGATIANSGTATGFGGAMTPAFHANLSANQTVSNQTDTKVQFDTEVLDTDGCYDNSTNYRFTPTTAGKYFVYSTLHCNANGANNFKLGTTTIKKNGSNIIYSQMDQRTTANGYSNAVNAFGIVDMNGSSDYLESWGYVDDSDSGGSSPRISGNSSAQYSLFGAYRIIE
tara:strand:- start:2361 stop:2987 length:627 start_codon:yes stop_codon:yes gene_type:complete